MPRLALGPETGLSPELFADALGQSDLWAFPCSTYLVGCCATVIFAIFYISMLLVARNHQEARRGTCRQIDRSPRDFPAIVYIIRDECRQR